MYYVTIPEVTGEESKKKGEKIGVKITIYSLPLNEQNMLNN